MEDFVILVVYIAIMILLIVAEVYLLNNDKGRYLGQSYKALKNICSRKKDEEPCDLLAFTNDVSRFYDEYVQEYPKIKKYFPEVVVWMDSIIFRIDCGNKRAEILKEYVTLLKDIRNTLAERNPYNKCERYQQDILRDISKIKTDENKIIVQNILKRTEEEFIRLHRDNIKNDKINKISIAVGVIGIVVSIVMGIISF